MKDRWVRKHSSELAKSIRDQREFLYEYYGYDMNRGIDKVGEQTAFNFRSYVDRLLDKKGKVDYIDIGGGMLQFADEVKRVYGERVNVSVLNPFHPNVMSNKRQWNLFLERLNNESEKIPNNDAKVKAKFKNRKISQFSNANSRLQNLDNYYVGVIETYAPGKKYDLVTDWFSAIMYSPFNERVIERYLDITKDNGTALIGIESDEAHKIKKLITEKFGPKSKMSREKGAYFNVEIRETENYLNSIKVNASVLELKKVLLHKDQKNNSGLERKVEIVAYVFIGIALLLQFSSMTGFVISSKSTIPNGVFVVSLIFISFILLLYSKMRRRTK